MVISSDENSRLNCNATGAGPEIARVGRMSHGVRHEHGVFGVGNSGVQQNAIGSKFHGDGDVAGGANTGVHNDGIRRISSVFRVGQLFDDDSDSGWVGDTTS